MTQTELKHSKNNYLSGLLEGPSNSNTTPAVSKRFWSHVKNLCRNGTGIATLGEEMVSAKVKADTLSDQYSNVFTTENLSSIPSLPGNPLPDIDK